MPVNRKLNKYAITSNDYWSNRWNDFMLRLIHKYDVKYHKKYQIIWLYNVLIIAQKYYYRTQKELMSDNRFDRFESYLKQFTNYDRFNEETWHDYFKKVGN